MTTQTGAPAALQPDDTAAECDYTALLDAVYADSKPTPYVGHAPVMDAGAPGRAGEWLGVRVMHEPSRTFGEVAGRAPSGLWWVALRLGLCDTGPVLVRGDALTVATPELEAAVEAERERMRALLGPVKPGSGNRKGGRPHGRKTNQPDDPTVRRCNDCGRVFPLEEFRFKNKAANQRSYLCRACDNRRKREARAAAKRYAYIY